MTYSCVMSEKPAGLLASIVGHLKKTNDLYFSPGNKPEVKSII